MALFNRPHANSYRLSVPTVLCCIVSKIQRDIGRKSLFFVLFIQPGQKQLLIFSRCFFLTTEPDPCISPGVCRLGAAHALIDRQSDMRTDRQTDGKAMSIVQRTTWDYIAHCSLLTLSTSVNTSELTATWLQCVYFGVIWSKSDHLWDGQTHTLTA